MIAKTPRNTPRRSCGSAAKMVSVVDMVEGSFV
jgi:hypothetical protein